MVPSPTGAAPEAIPPGAGSRVALATLVTLVVLSPWPFGSVDPWAVRTITLVSLAVALGAMLWDSHRGTSLLPAIPLWPLAGLWLLAVFQLVPLPESLQRLIAPGSAGVWHPDVPAAAEVLGPGPHPISLYPDATRRWLAFATGLVSLALVAAPALRERRLLLRSAVAIVSGGVAVALYAFVARLAFGNKLYGIWSVPTVAPFGPFVNKNHFAGYVELAALLAVGLATGLAGESKKGPGLLSWIDSSRARYVVLAWGAAAVLVLAVPVSLSRGGVLSLAAGLLSIAALRLSSRREKRASPRVLLGAAAFAAALLVAVVSVIPSEARERLLTLTGVTTEQSGAYRLAVWSDSLGLARSSPWLGSGFGAFADALPRFKTAAGHLAVEHAENEYLELLADGGLLGVVLAAVLATLCVATGIAATAGAHERLARGLAAGAVAGLVAAAVHGAFDFNPRIPANASLAVALAAFALAASAAAPPAPWRRSIAAPVAVTIALAAFTTWSAHVVEPGGLTRAAASPEAALRRAGLEAELAAQLRARPADAAAWLALAWLRAGASPEDAGSLAGWAVRLDPESDSVRAAHARLAR